MTNPIADIATADFILAIGTNTTETHPVISLFVRRALRRGARLVTIDTRRTEMADLSHMHLQLRPGTDLALLSAMAHVIIRDELFDSEFISERTEGFEQVKEAVQDATPLWAAEITGVDAELIEATARQYAAGNPSSILYTMGVTQHTSGTANVLGLANLALLTGNLGRRGGGINPLRGQNNVQGACDMGALPGVLTGYQSVTDANVRERFAQTWGVDTLPSQPGMMIGDMMDAALAGTLKAMYVVGENPVISDPDKSHVEAALENLDFLVVQDIFLTETASLADVVLPAASFAEKEGTFTNTERRLQRVRKAVEPPGDARPDSEIISMLGRAMGHDFSYPNASAIMDEIALLTPSYGGFSHRRLDQQPLHWPCPDAEHPGTPVLHVGAFPRGRGRLTAVRYSPPAEATDRDYPLLLGTGRRPYHYHTGTMTRRSPLSVISPAETLDINPQDAEELGIADGDTVRIYSRRGQMDVAARTTDRVAKGTVFASFHFSEAPVNVLTNPARDKVAGIPELKVSAVRVERLGP